MVDTLSGLVALTKLTFNILSEQRYEEALSLFRLGVNILNSKAGVTLLTIANESGVSQNRLKMCVRLAEALNSNEDKFKEIFNGIQYASFDKIYAKCVGGGQKRHGISNSKISSLLSNIEKSLEDIATRGRATKQLTDMRRRINNVIMPPLQLTDKDYLKYYGCCSCGSYPPPEGGYILYEKDDMTIPLCSECYAKSRAINYEYVARMWSNYALQLNRVIMAGTLRLSDNELDDDTYI